VSIVVDIQTVSIAIASAGVFLAAVYYILQIRHQRNVRNSDLVIRLYTHCTSDEWEEAYMRILNAHFEDYEDFSRKYGGLISENPVSIAAGKVSAFYEQLGYLLYRKLIDADMVFQLFSIARPWNKIKPMAYGARKQLGQPNLYEWFEYLYNEMQKREQKLQSKA